MSLQLHRPDGKGGLERRTVDEPDYRNQLQSARWGKALSGGRLPRLPNAEMNPTSIGRSVALWLALAAVTFAILVVGYGTGFWSFAR